MNKREAKRAKRRINQRHKRNRSRTNRVLMQCGICGEHTNRVGAQAMYIGDDGSVIPYIVCPRCVKNDLKGNDANRELAAIRAEFNLGISEPVGGVQ